MFLTRLLSLFVEGHKDENADQPWWLVGVFRERHTTRGEDFVMDHSGGEVTFRYFRLV